jgi:anti-sigma factor RsiW
MMLPLYAGGDVAEREACVVEEHLQDCPSCRKELETFKAVISAGRRKYDNTHQLEGVVRSRIAFHAASDVKAARHPFRAPLFALASRPAGLLAPAAAAMVIALIALPIALRERIATQESAEQVMKIEVVAEPGAVKLAWSDGPRSSYTVYKSDNPRIFGSHDAHVVKGNVWVDQAPETSPIVFYKIE